MKIIDMHCDTILELLLHRQRGEQIGLRENDLMIDLNKLKQGGYSVQNFALFVDMGDKSMTPFEKVCALIDVFKGEMEANSNLTGLVLREKERELDRILLELKKEFLDGKIILLDRYTTSSLIYQGTLVKDLEDRKKYIDYVCDYEYKKLGIASPDMVIFLSAPFDVVTNLRKNRKDYEGNVNDIHEVNIEYMKDVYNNAMFISEYLNWDKVICNNENESEQKIEVK